MPDRAWAGELVGRPFSNEAVHGPVGSRCQIAKQFLCVSNAATPKTDSTPAPTISSASTKNKNLHKSWAGARFT